MIYDYIIVGAGIAGLNAARLLPKNKRVLILCKMSTWNSNTFWAQGGIASAVDKKRHTNSHKRYSRSRC